MDGGVIYLVKHVVGFQAQIQPPARFAELERTAERGIQAHQAGTRNGIAACVAELARRWNRKRSQVEEACCGCQVQTRGLRPPASDAAGLRKLGGVTQHARGQRRSALRGYAAAQLPVPEEAAGQSV